MDQLFKQFDIVGLIVVGVLVSLAVEAVNRITPNKISPKLILFIISAIVTSFSIEFDFTKWQELIKSILLYMSFAILFYTYIGGWVVEKIFSVIKGRFEDNTPNIGKEIKP
jgi:uncharacterized protein YacL